MSLGSHQRSIGKSQNHITPKWIIDELGPFDLDPCAAWPRPWQCAATNRTKYGMAPDMPWLGFVWLNPPFDRRQVHLWVQRLSTHNNGIALLHARTETGWFLPCWEHASAILFLASRIKFCLPDGTEQKANSGAPPVLVGFGPRAKYRLASCRIPGVLLTNWTIK